MLAVLETTSMSSASSTTAGFSVTRASGQRSRTSASFSGEVSPRAVSWTPGWAAYAAACLAPTPNPITPARSGEVRSRRSSSQPEGLLQTRRTMGSKEVVPTPRAPPVDDERLPRSQPQLLLADRLKVSGFFVNFNASEEDGKRKKFRSDEDAGFFYTFVGKKR
jgi:hypothetical protein